MAVTFRASSQSGTSDAFATSCAIPVPTGTTTDDIVILILEQWESTNPTVTWPTGFTEKINLVSGSQKLKCAWKRPTGSDTGNYTPSWTGSQWCMGHAITIDGADTTDDPISATNTATGTGTTTPSTTASSTGEPFLVHCVANESTATGTPPTSYTETRDGDYLHTNYRIPAATGSHTASGGSLSVSTLQLVALLIIEPESGGSTQTIVCQAITASTSLFNPQVIQIIKNDVLNVPSTVLNPTVAPGSVNIACELLQVPSSVANPKVIQIVQSLAIDASSTVLSPAVSVGSVSIACNVLNTSSSILEPIITNNGTIAAPAISAASVVLNPTVVNLLQIVQAQSLQTLSSVLNPAIVGGGGLAVANTSLMDRARTNMLTELVLTEPQLASNVDLMRQVIIDPGQTTVTVTDATAAVHLWQYLIAVRNS